MNAKDKAKELYYKFLFEKSESISCSGAKLFSLIAVDELIKEELFWIKEVGGNESESQWIKVKQEIDKL